ncbi:cation:proton antiporter [Mangrovicella endophytica]|uniref:cation:proton antiporter domain-containing protein n=1 Tax=Mangrovicella endophytica TaxID=2066697 RepID=UPI000C9E51B7|nr:cation:proton antiporter [Mangrovicella endophytica]
MPHATPLITTIVAGIVLAFILGAIAQRLRLPPLVGYLIGGVLVGPHTPGYVADQALAPELAEIGVILLMFGVGLHFSLKDLLSVRGIAVPGAIVQIAAATLLGWGLAALLGWPMGGGLVFGLALSVASTVVLLKALQERRLVETEKGRIAVGWLIVEDLAMVLALVLIPAAAGLSADGGHGGSDPAAILLSGALGLDLGLWGIIATTLLKVAAFVVLMLVVGRRVIPWILHRIAHTGSRELFRLGVLAIALGVAFGASELFGVSLALGAFFAGMILSESELSHRAAQESLPLRDAFAVLFFVSVGMLFDPGILLREPLPVLATLAIIVLGKSAAAYLIVRSFGYDNTVALTISASLAQIGEFSFILAELGVGLELLPEAGRDLILAGAILSIILNPLVFFLVDGISRRFAASPVAAGQASQPAASSLDVMEGEHADASQSLPAPDGAATAEAAHSIDAADSGRSTAALTQAAAEQPATAATGEVPHVVLVGYGRVGRLVADRLAASGTPLLVIEDADAAVRELRAQGIEVVVGNAAAPDILAMARLNTASALVVAIPSPFDAGQVVEQARSTRPDLYILARAHFDSEVDHLERLGADTVIMGEREIARGMAEHLEARFPQPNAA